MTTEAAVEARELLSTLPPLMISRLLATYSDEFDVSSANAWELLADDLAGAMA